MDSVPHHPFYPLGTSLTGYIANDWSMSAIFGVFGGCLVTLFTLTRQLNQSLNPHLSRRDQALLIWFVLSGFIHLIIEGYFSVNHTRMPTLTDYLGQGWKEYSKCDSRYMTGDSFIVSMETVTAFAWGPLCLVEAWFILINSPWRHPLQMLVSVGQFYGDLLYFATVLVEHAEKSVEYSRPEALYFWGYFMGMNAFWIIIPAYCIATSMKEIAEVFKVAQSQKGKLAANVVEKKRA
ncbi:emopamil binding protein [Rhizodiscina lignyota]|uniref:Emopamil binding protein n=1 Tax=Rhizodiscina lignyota TaxID=1504668 RepID=A0A9P4IMM0_9PEZI|nr:emopamil binding protein [Rhizodiscina lignyota]